MIKSIDMSLLETLVVKNFPYSTFNSGQKEVIIDACVSILNGTKHTIISAPTGVGKSVIAITIHKVLEDYKKEFNTVILTTTKGLQDQYKKDFANILLDIKGKNNYPCLKNTQGYSSPGCISALSSKSCEKFKCPYLIARDFWVNHEGVKTTNSSYFLKAPDSIIPTSEPNIIDLCIIDECHEIDKVVIENTTLNFNILNYRHILQVYKNFESEYKKFELIMHNLPSECYFTFQEISDDNKNFINELVANLKTIKESCESRLEAYDNSVALQTIVKYKMCISECKELSNMLRILTHDFYNNDIFKWVRTTAEDGGIKVIPLSSATKLTNLVLFNKAKQFIHMSATIGGFEQYCKNLGLKHENCVYIEVENPIHKDKRKVIVNETLQINYKTNPKDIVKLIDNIIEKEQNNGNGVIHTVSFKLAQDIKQYSKFRNRMIVSNNRSEILSKLEKSNDSIILSPSVETGYDFKEDLARWQIISKMPYLNLGDLYVSERLKLSSNWYARETVLRLIQASGRVTRGVNDFGITYIIDRNIFNLLEKHFEMFPEWYLESLEI